MIKMLQWGELISVRIAEEKKAKEKQTMQSSVTAYYLVKCFCYWIYQGEYELVTFTYRKGAVVLSDCWSDGSYFLADYFLGGNFPCCEFTKGK